MSDPMMYSVIQSRLEGFVPKSQEISLEFEVPTTLDPNPTYTEVLERSTEVDSYLR